MKSFGAPVDFVSEQKELTEYPVVIAPAYQLADKELVNKWIAYVKNGGKQYEWNTWGEILIPASDSQVWATYANEFYEGGPAVTFRKLGKGTVTYVGVDSHNGALEKDILKKLYAQLQIPVMDLPYGITVEYRNGLGIVLNYSDRSYTFDIPEGSKVLVGTEEIPTAGVLVFSM